MVTSTVTQDHLQTNVPVDDNGAARLCDFGLVRLVDFGGPSGLTMASPYAGTQRYKAPPPFISPVNRHPVVTFVGDIYLPGIHYAGGTEILEGKIRYLPSECRSSNFSTHSKGPESKISGTRLRRMAILMR